MVDGLDGASAFELAVQKGYRGSLESWLESLKGLPGRDGKDGEKGEQGLKGDPGRDGDRGPQGLRGDPGERGDKGERGERGPKGERGPSGKDASFTPQTHEAFFVRNTDTLTQYVDVLPLRSGPSWRITPERKDGLITRALITPN
jgi:hypothetical protein